MNEHGQRILTYANRKCSASTVGRDQGRKDRSCLDEEKAEGSVELHDLTVACDVDADSIDGGLSMG